MINGAHDVPSLHGWMAGLMDWWIGCDVLWWIESLMRLRLGLFFREEELLCFFFSVVHSGKQLIFGQLLATPGCGLHPLHWVEVMGTANGTPRHLEILDRWVGGSNRLGSLRCEIVWRLGPGKVRRLWSRPVVNVALKNVRRYAEIQKGGNLEGWWIFDDIHWINFYVEIHEFPMWRGLFVTRIHCVFFGEDQKTQKKHVAFDSITKRVCLNHLMDHQSIIQLISFVS